MKSGFQRAMPLVVAVATVIGSQAAASAATKAKVPKGAPLVIMAMGTFQSATLSLDTARAGVEAHVKAINDAGGINGRPIKVVLCNDNFDPNQAAACGRKAVDNKVLAVVGAASSYSGQVLAILQQWNIPFLNGQGTGGAIELTNPVSFPLHGGTAVQQVGMGRSLANAGSKSIVVIAADVDVARKAGEDVIRGAKLGGASASAVYAPLGAPDYSAVAAAALDKKPDGIAIAHVPADAPKIILALRQAGYTGRISTLMSVLNAAGIKAIGDAAEGVFLLDRASQPTNTSIPQIKEYQEGLAKYEPKATIDPNSLNGWISVSFFQQLVLQMGKAKITPESLLAKVRKLDKPIVVGAFPDYTGPSATPPVPEFPQVVTFQANLLKVQGGVVVPNGGFFNPLAP